MIASTSCSESGVVSLVENDFGLSKDCVVFDLCFSNDGAVIGEKDELGISGAESSQCRLISENVFATFHDQGQFAIDVFRSSFLHHRLIKINANIILNYFILSYYTYIKSKTFSPRKNKYYQFIPSDRRLLCPTCFSSTKN